MYMVIIIKEGKYCILLLILYIEEKYWFHVFEKLDATHHTKLI
jgi:hypothetical protein